MKRFLTIVALLLIAACARIPNPITPTVAYNLQASYGVAQSAAVSYTELRRCADGVHASITNICSEHAVIVKLADADAKARIALTALEQFSRNPDNYPGLTFAGLVAAAQSAVSVLVQIERSNGVTP